MTSERIRGSWNEIKGKVKQRWGELTDDELQQAEGKRDELIGIIQRKYGGAREDIARELDDF